MFSKAKPLLSLTEYCSIIGISPYLMSQVGEPREAMGIDSTSCERVVFQAPWQSSEAITRDDFTDALLQSQELVAKVLNYFPAPHFRQEALPYPRPANLDLGQLYYGRSGRLKSVESDYKRIISVGVYENTLLDDNVLIATSDPNNDGFDTWFSLSVAVPNGTTADEIKVYYNASDRLELTLDESEIYPLNVTISGNTATITGNLYQVILPENYLKLVPPTLDASDSLIYVESLDVYRQTIDLNQSGLLIWNLNAYLFGWCDEPPCQFTVSSACFATTGNGARRGFIEPIPATFDETIDNYVRAYPAVAFAPDEVILNYVSGIPKVNGRMAKPYNQIVAYLATALLSQRNCGCQRADLRLSYYRDLPTDDSGNLRVDQSVFTLASQLFGVSGRGAIQAMQMLLDQNLIEYRTATL